MVFSSFYGGRQGASFVIVKRFDAISITPESEYSYAYYAIDGNFYLCSNGQLIEKNNTNYADYKWKATALSGAEISNLKSIDGNPPPLKIKLPQVYQEGMVQCFAKGGDSTNIVNYGEYVIIDTPVKDNPDNGKVFRRGINYNNEDELCGAEYIGQIVGPTGSTPEVNVDAVSEILTMPGAKEGAYTYTAHDIVPGKIDETHFNDNIGYAWANLRDAADNVIGAVIGFTFPYLVAEFKSKSRSAYYTQEDLAAGIIDDPSLIGTRISETEDLFIDNGASSADRDPTHGDTGHPFFRRWKISIPQGVKGSSISELKIFPIQIKEGAQCYQTDSQGQRTGNVFISDRVMPIKVESYWDTYKNGYVLVQGTVEGVTGVFQVELADTINLHYGYLYTWYDDHVDGQDHRWIDIGSYRTVKEAKLSDDGWLSIYYTADYEDPFTGIKADNPDILDEPLQWIKDVWIDTGNEEGTGDQKVHITYNTKTPDGRRKTAVIGDPINYIVESLIAEKDNPYGASPNHLLVWYSDPAYREQLAQDYPLRIYRYKGTKDEQAKDGWFDLGYVRGEYGGIHIIGNVSVEDDLYNDGATHADPKTPEDIGGSSDFSGWVMTVWDGTAADPVIYAFDYINNIWYPLGDINASLLDPRSIITTEEPESLKPHGFWLISKTIKYVG